MCPSKALCCLQRSTVVYSDARGSHKQATAAWLHCSGLESCTGLRESSAICASAKTFASHRPQSLARPPVG